METLAGRVAVVTGGASGIGRAMAERFLSEGMRVAIADIEAARLDGAVADLSARGEVAGFMTDVCDPASVDELAGRVVERFGAYHVVCNNAGVPGHFGLTWETPEADWKWVFDVNVMGVVHGIRSFVPGLVEQGAGHVVNTASLAAWLGGPTMGPYCASKHAVLAISESLRNELQARGSEVGVTVLCPGMINTSLMAGERNWPQHLGAPPDVPDDKLTQAVWDMLVQGTTGGGLGPESAAEAVVDAIRTGTFVATTHPQDVVAAAERRLAAAKGEPAVQ